MAKQILALCGGPLVIAVALVPVFAGASALAPSAYNAQAIPTSVLIATPSTIPAATSPLAPLATPVVSIRGTALPTFSVPIATNTPLPTPPPTSTPTAPTPTIPATVQASSRPPIGVGFDSMQLSAERAIDEFSGGRPAWSPDGSYVVFAKRGEVVQGSSGNGWFKDHLWICAADGSNPHLLVANGSQPAWSKDGRWVYFLAFEPRDLDQTLTNHDIYRIHPNGAGKELLYRGNAWVRLAGGQSSLVPLRDGRLGFIKDRKEIAWLDPDAERVIGSVPNVDVSGGPYNGFIVAPGEQELGHLDGDGILRTGPVDGSSFRQVAKIDYAVNATWSPTGASLAYTTGDALWVSGPHGTNARRLAGLSQFASPLWGATVAGPQWSPDGRLIFVGYHPEPHAVWDTYVIEPTSGRVRLLARGKLLLATAPDGTRALLSEPIPPAETGRVRLVVATVTP